MKIRRRLLVLSAAGTVLAMASTLLGFIFLLRVEYSLAAGDLSLETHRYLRLRVLGEFPWAFRAVWTLKLLAVVLAGLYLAAWSRTLREEKPFFTQAALYFLGLGVTLEGLAWTQAVHGLPSLAAWFEETVTADQAIPFRLFGILQGEQNLLSNGLALGFLSLAGSLLGAASRSSKNFPRPLGVLGLGLSLLGLGLSLGWHALAIHGAWAISILLGLAGLAYLAYAARVWFRYAEDDLGD